jgi:hypothetical protein
MGKAPVEDLNDAITKKVASKERRKREILKGREESRFYQNQQQSCS